MITLSFTSITSLCRWYSGPSNVYIKKQELGICSEGWSHIAAASYVSGFPVVEMEYGCIIWFIIVIRLPFKTWTGFQSFLRTSLFFCCLKNFQTDDREKRFHCKFCFFFSFLFQQQLQLTQIFLLLEYHQYLSHITVFS